MVSPTRMPMTLPAKNVFGAATPNAESESNRASDVVIRLMIVDVAWRVLWQ